MMDFPEFTGTEEEGCRWRVQMKGGWIVGANVGRGVRSSESLDTFRRLGSKSLRVPWVDFFGLTLLISDGVGYLSGIQRKAHIQRPTNFLSRKYTLNIH